MATAEVKLKEPSALIDLSKKDQTFWTERDTRMKDVQDLVEQTTDVGDDVEVEDIDVRSSDGAIIVRKLSAMVGSQTPILNIPVPPPLKETAERVEDLVRAARFEQELRHAQGARAPLAYDEAQSIFLRGWITGRILLNADTDDNYLWDYTLFDPMQVYPRYSRNKLTRVTTVSDTTVGEVIGEWGKDAEKLFKDTDEEQKIKVYGYYDKEQMALATDQGWLKKPTKHGYPFGVPWVIVLGPGAFYRQTASDQQNFTRYVGQGVLDIVRDQIRNWERSMTMLHQLVAREAEPATVVYTNAEGEVIQLDLRSGGRNVLAATDKLELLKVGPDLQSLRILGDMYREQVFKGTIPPVLFGDNQANMTGFLANVLQGSARDLVFPYIRALETYYTLLYGKMLALFAQFGTDMDVVSTDRLGQAIGGVTVSKLDVGQIRTSQIRVKFKDITPKDEAAKVQMAIGLTREHLVSPETAREKYLDVENPVQEEAKVLGSLAFMDPMIVRTASALSLQKQLDARGMTTAELAQIVQSVVQATAMQQGQGGPGAPPGAPPGLPGQGPPPPNTSLPPNAVPPEMAAAAGLPPGQAPIGPAPNVPTPQNLQLPLQ